MVDMVSVWCERLEELYGRRIELEGGPAPVTVRVPGWIVVGYVNGDEAITLKAYSHQDLKAWVDRALIHRIENPGDDWVTAMLETEEG